MTTRKLILRSLRFHFKSHIGVLLGAFIGTAALTGALLVGDSVRETLKQHALARLGPIHFILFTPERLFTQTLSGRLMALRGSPSTPDSSKPITVPDAATAGASALILPATVNRQDGAARANQVTVLGVDTNAWPAMAQWQRQFKPAALALWISGEGVFLNETLARQLKVAADDELIVRVRKPSALAADAAISPRNDSSVALRVKVAGILKARDLGDFSVYPSQMTPANLFVALPALAARVGSPDSANLVALPALRTSDSDTVPQLNVELDRACLPEDLSMTLQAIEPSQSATGGELVPPFVQLSSSRIFLEDQIVTAALGSSNETNITRFLTYFANLIWIEDRAAPYSMITAAPRPYVPADMKDDEIVINDWLASDLKAQPGAEVEVSYYVVDSGSHLLERTNRFRIRAVVPLKGIYADRTLMPEFPGVAKAESTLDWDAGFPLVYTIREKDEAYWKAHRGTPKGFITLTAGQKMWGNRFGSLTAVRYAVPAGFEPEPFRAVVARNLMSHLRPGTLGLHFEPVRQQALNAASQAQDFGQLFLGFSFFLLISALLLVAMLFQFGLEQRMPETGTFLALGFRPRQVRNFLLIEGVALALLGGVLGVLGGIGYGRVILWGLGSVWRGAVGAIDLQFFATPGSILIGFLAGSFVAALTIFFAVRRQARQPVVRLLAGEGPGLAARSGGGFPWTGLCCSFGALLILGWAFGTGNHNSAGAFFGAGSLLLIAGLSLAGSWLTRLGLQQAGSSLSVTTLGVRGCGRRRSRSLMTIALLSCGCFVVAAIGVFRIDSHAGASRKDAGTGGFPLIGQSSLPIFQDRNSPVGREALGLSEADMTSVRVVPFRVHEGDEASCLNLNRAQKPRLLGVRPELVSGRFHFSSVAAEYERQQGWDLLTSDLAKGDEIAAIGDANSIEWALGKKVGDTIDYTDERGRSFKLRLVGAVANSILQGNLVIDEAAFVKLFPNESGYRFFLIDAPTQAVAKLSASLSRALQDQGFEVVATVDRLNAFNAVQNTYLGTFQALGGLGLLLGSAGVGVVLLRNVLERRGELAVLMAVGFRSRRLRALLLTEHGALLGLGLMLGILSAAVAVLPAIMARGELPYVSLSVTLVAVVLSGLFWTWLAARFALRGNLLAALRNE